MIHLSERGIPLVYTGENNILPVITIENYMKWYKLYTVLDGSVLPLSVRIASRYEKENTGSPAWSDHIPTPWFCKWIFDRYEDYYEWDYMAYELIIGRWIREGRSLIPQNILI